MKRFILTIGPRASGKTTFCKKYDASHSNVVLISRDLMAQRLRKRRVNIEDKSYLLDDAMLWQMAELVFRRRKKDLDIIFDFWNMTADERSAITARAREIGADQVQGWHFVTPDQTCAEWLQKQSAQKTAKMYEIRGSKLNPRPHQTDEFALEHLKSFRQQPVDLNQGFDHIRLIDPLTADPKEFIILNTIEARQ